MYQNVLLCSLMYHIVTYLVNCSNTQEQHDSVFGNGVHRMVIPYDASKNVPITSQNYRQEIESSGTTAHHAPVFDALHKAGYQVTDYVKGHAKSTDPEDKRTHSIGKLLQKHGADEDLKKTFMNDPHRASGKTSEYDMVITNHAHDIGGMSTGRGWI